MEGNLVARPIIAHLENARVIKDPVLLSCATGVYCSFKVQIAKDVGSREPAFATINAYDEWAERIVKKMKLRKGDYISGSFIFCPYTKRNKCYTDKGTETEILSSEYSFKVMEIYVCFFHENKEKKGKEEETAKPTNVGQIIDFSCFENQ